MLHAVCWCIVTDILAAHLLTYLNKPLPPPPVVVPPPYATIPASVTPLNRWRARRVVETLRRFALKASINNSDVATTPLSPRSL